MSTYNRLHLMHGGHEEENKRRLMGNKQPCSRKEEKHHEQMIMAAIAVCGSTRRHHAFCISYSACTLLTAHSGWRKEEISHSRAISCVEIFSPRCNAHCALRAQIPAQRDSDQIHANHSAGRLRLYDFSTRPIKMPAPGLGYAASNPDPACSHETE